MSWSTLETRPTLGPREHFELPDSYIYSFGLLLTVALVAGQAALWLRLPRVTAYLLVGLLLGPHVFGAIPEEHLQRFHPLLDMAMALVLFNMGCHFSLGYFRKILRGALRLSAGELAVTMLLVTLGMLLVGQSWQVAVLFGVLALATAPATTVLVLKENESEGPITEYSMALVALNNLAAIVAFEAVLVGIFFLNNTAGTSAHEHLVWLGLDLAASLGLGIAGGLLISYACGLLSPNRWLVLLVAVATGVLGLCEVLAVPYLLTFLAMGATVANASDRTNDVRQELERITGLLCVVFFVTHGAELDIGALWAAGIVGVVYIAARSGGKYLGIYLAAGKKGNRDVRKWLGVALLSQAGAALALKEIAVERVPDLGKALEPIILGTVVFFEFVGPLLIRRAVLSAGEMPLDKAIHHQATTPWMELRNMCNRLLLAMGFDPWHLRSPDDLTVSDIMRKNYVTIQAAATFDELISVLEHSHDNIFPVINGDGELLGVIRYRELRNAVFDPKLGRLVRAVDLAQPAINVLHPDGPLRAAWELVRNSPDDLIPVGSQGRLVGMVARRDLYRFFLKRSE